MECNKEEKISYLSQIIDIMEAFESYETIEEVKKYANIYKKILKKEIKELENKKSI